jgi:hypothetical protein
MEVESFAETLKTFTTRTVHTQKNLQRMRTATKTSKPVKIKLI